VADVLTTGSDVTIAACGHLVWEALEAANALEAEGISAEVINFSTIKPLDKKALLGSVGKTGRLVTAEEHQRNGGLGDSLAQLLALEMPSPVEMVAVNDSFGESGTPAQLMDKYGLNTKSIIASVHRVMSR
ncbi:MAG: transketolase C-terminal domain-containing protein, partial [Schleiferiaceae bacterium]|nr:transketolase C-terminal domain-containing protein [Schleiferiaceae bacterium]